MARGKDDRKKRDGEARSRARRRPRHLYFAYGSNLSVDGMQRRCPDAVKVGPAWLGGHALVFRGVADVVERKGSVAAGGVWLVSDDDLTALDRYEGYPRMYGRKLVDVRDADGKAARAIVYFMHDDRLALPSQFYFDIIVEGYRDFGLDRAPLDAALTEAEERIAAKGYTRLVPDGRKRMVPVAHAPAYRSRRRTTKRAEERSARDAARAFLRDDGVHPDEIDLILDDDDWTKEVLELMEDEDIDGPFGELEDGDWGLGGFWDGERFDGGRAIA